MAHTSYGGKKEKVMDNDVVKKKRGRPSLKTQQLDLDIPEVVDIPKKRRGRPRKVVQEMPVQTLESNVSDAVVVPEETPVIIKKRGRPRKNPVEQPETERIPKKRGRKPKYFTKENQTVEAYQKFGSIRVRGTATANATTTDVVEGEFTEAEARDMELCELYRKNYSYYACVARLCNCNECKFRRPNTDIFLKNRDIMVDKYKVEELACFLVKSKGKE